MARTIPPGPTPGDRVGRRAGWWAGRLCWSAPYTDGDVDLPLHQEFAAAIAGRDTDVDLYGGAMAIARIGHPLVDIHHYAARLDALGEEAAESAGATRDPERLAAAIDNVLFSRHEIGRAHV